LEPALNVNSINEILKPYNLTVGQIYRLREAQIKEMDNEIKELQKERKAYYAWDVEYKAISSQIQIKLKTLNELKHEP
jgi:predicted MPP superfamily phosphohydrolase